MTGIEGSEPHPVEDILRPGGKLVGEPGRRPNVRYLEGGEAAALGMFAKLCELGEEVDTSHPRIRRVNMAPLGHASFRPFSRSGEPTIDVSIEGIGITEIKFR